MNILIYFVSVLVKAYIRTQKKKSEKEREYKGQENIKVDKRLHQWKYIYTNFIR